MTACSNVWLLRTNPYNPQNSLRIIILRWLNKVLVTLALLTVIGFCLGGVLVAFAYPQLPSLDVLTDYRQGTPARLHLGWRIDR